MQIGLKNGGQVCQVHQVLLKCIRSPHVLKHWQCSLPLLLLPEMHLFPISLSGVQVVRKHVTKGSVTGFREP